MPHIIASSPSERRDSHRQQRNGSEEAGRERGVVLRPVLPRRESHLAAWTRPVLPDERRPAVQMPSHQGLSGLKRAVLRLEVVADQPIRPEVRDAHDKLEPSGRGGVRHVHAERRLPKRGAGAPVDRHVREVLHVAEVEEEARPGGGRRHRERLAVGGRAGEELQVGVVERRPVRERGQFQRLHRQTAHVPVHGEGERPRARHVPTCDLRRTTGDLERRQFVERRCGRQGRRRRGRFGRTEHDEPRGAGLERDAHRRHAVLGSVGDAFRHLARFGIPELGHAARDAEGDVHTARRLARRGDEVPVRPGVAPMNPVELRRPVVPRDVRRARGENAFRLLKRQDLGTGGLEARDTRPRRGQKLERLLRQDERTVALPRRQHKFAVLDPHLGERRVRHEVVGEARRHGHGHLVRIVSPVDVEVAGRAVPRDVADERPFLKQELAALLVLQPRLRLLPPRLGAVEVHTERPHRHAGEARGARPRLVRETVVDDAVEAFRINPVALRLHAPRRVLPAPFLRVRREGLRRDEAPPLRVGDRRRLAHPVRTVQLRPELGRRNVGVLAVEKVIRRDLAVGLDRELQAAGVREAAHLARVVRGEGVRDGQPEVAVEVLRLGDGADDAAAQGGQPRRDRVAGVFGERPLEAVRPVLRADLVAVVQHRPERPVRPGQSGAERLHRLLDVVRPVDAQGLLRELVAFESLAEARPRAVLAVEGAVADAQDRPVARRQRAGERPVREVRREGAHLFAPHHGGGGRDARVGDVILAAGVGEALELPVLQLERLRGRRERHDGDVAVEAHLVLRLRQGDLHGTASLDRRRGEADRLHRVVGRVPRAARVRPARTVRHAELQPETLRLLGRELHRRVPLRRVEGERPLRDAPARAEARVEEDRAADAGLGHRLQVGRDARARHVARHPVPPDLRLGRVRRRAEAGLKACRTNLRTKERGRDTERLCYSLHGYLYFHCYSEISRTIFPAKPSSRARLRGLSPLGLEPSTCSTLQGGHSRKA